MSERIIKINDLSCIEIAVTPVLFVYEVPDFLGRPMPILGIKLDWELEEQFDEYATITKSFGEFIETKNAAYMDLNNCPYATKLLELGVAKETGHIKYSGHCFYPLWVFTEDFLKEIGGEDYEQYSKAFDDYIKVTEFEIPTDILSELQVECPFPEVFEDKTTEGTKVIYNRKIGHTRADYDGNRWWNYCWPCRKELLVPLVTKEMDAVYEHLISPDAFGTLDKLTEFCRAHPKARANEHTDSEYNFYYVGKLCFFWIRCITRKKDYNLYLHIFIKQEPTGGRSNA